MKYSTHNNGVEPFETAAARLTVHLNHIVDNWRSLCRIARSAQVAAVVKADAYGLGLEDVASALYRAGCNDFFVAGLNEAVRLRPIAPEARIFILSGMWEGQQAEIIGYRLIPVLASAEQLSLFLGLCMDGSNPPFALHVDTGMGRLGFMPEDAIRLGLDTRFRSRFQPAMIMSHLACGDQKDHPMNRAQLESFQEVGRAFEGVESSLGNSAGIFLGPDYHFDMVRPGIALYGGEAMSGMANPMLPGVTAEARILQVKTVKAGQTVSYGATHRFETDARIAVVGAGYADGWHRAMSGSGVPLRSDKSNGVHGVVKGFSVPLVGRVTMDQSVFDISAAPEHYIRSGDYIELFGEYVGLDDVARAAGTIGYELLTSLGQRYARRYRGG